MHKIMADFVMRYSVSYADLTYLVEAEGVACPLGDREKAGKLYVKEFFPERLHHHFCNRPCTDSKQLVNDYVDHWADYPWGKQPEPLTF